jgi:hypothetical protein
MHGMTETDHIAALELAARRTRAETAKLEAEAEKLSAEHYKLRAEELKLQAEELKLEREADAHAFNARWWRLLVASGLGGLIVAIGNGITSYIARH